MRRHTFSSMASCVCQQTLIFSHAAAREVVSSVDLQKLIYYNSLFSAAWWLTTVSILLNRVRVCPPRL